MKNVIFMWIKLLLSTGGKIVNKLLTFIHGIKDHYAHGYQHSYPQGKVMVNQTNNNSHGVLMNVCRYGLLGKKISYALSPAIHNRWFIKRGIAAVFDLLDVSCYEHAVLDRAWSLGYRGICVTVPYKTQVMRYPGLVLDCVAQSVGAANVLRYDGADKQGCPIVCATNTDAQALDDALHMCSVSGAVGVVLGAGGAAMATLWALRQHGIGRIVLAVRDTKKVEALCSAGGIHADAIISIETLSDVHADIFVNATTLGRGGELPPIPKGASLVVDWVYRPSAVNNSALPEVAIGGDFFPIRTQPTPLIQKAKQQGILTIDGESLLLGQARRAFSFWFECF